MLNQFTAAGRATGEILPFALHSSLQNSGRNICGAGPVYRSRISLSPANLPSIWIDISFLLALGTILYHLFPRIHSTHCFISGDLIQFHIRATFYPHFVIHFGILFGQLCPQLIQKLCRKHVDLLTADYQQCRFYSSSQEESS